MNSLAQLQQLSFLEEDERNLESFKSKNVSCQMNNDVCELNNNLNNNLNSGLDNYSNLESLKSKI